jgi:signal transduction histidine kinase
MNRAQASTLVFAALTALVTVATAFVAYRGQRAAFEREFARRLSQLAELAASQISPADLTDARVLGSDGNGLVALQLDALCSATGLANVSVVDDSAHVVYDVRAGFATAGTASPYDTLSHATLERARETRSVAFPPFRRGALEVRAAAARIADAPGAVLVAEDLPRWGPELSRLRRDLSLLAAVSVLAVAALALLVMRANTSQVGLERRLSRAQNLAAMGRMTATLAHEIKNPLAIIRGSARRLAKLEPEAQALSDSVVEEVDRLSATVNRYLQFARGAGEGVPADARGLVAGTLVATLDLLEGEFRARGIELVREAKFAEATVRLDDASLKQVWLNLLQNALEACPEGGQVRVRCAVEGSRVRVAIADDGAGIAPDVLARVGEPFFTTRAQGTGLGVHLSRQLVQGAGGALELTSRAGAGTTVQVVLPLAGAPAGGFDHYSSGPAVG